MKYLVLLLLALPGFVHAAEIETLSKTSASWDGTPVFYPKGEPEFTAIKLVMKPGEEMPFHCHPFSTIGYIISGELLVEKLNGESHLFKAGDTISEVVNIWHRGRNPSKTETMELIGFYAGAKGTPTTTMYSKENTAACK